MRTLSEIRSNLSDTTRETQINDLIDEYINLTLMECQDPAWAFEQAKLKGFQHLWSFNRRKTTLSISAETAQLPRDLDKIALIRQTDSPSKLSYVPDEVFYLLVPYPTATGNPLYYRLWEEEGVETRLSTDDTIDIVSGSTADTTQTISLVGYDTNGLIRSESLSINGKTDVTGSITFDAGRPIRVSKSAHTTGIITVKEHTAGTTLLKIAPEERSPRFKVIGVYPIVTSAKTLYLEYYTRIRRLYNDADVPDIDEKWIWVVRLGALAKILQYQGSQKQTQFTTIQAMYSAGVRSMVRADEFNVDFIPHLKKHYKDVSTVVTHSKQGRGSYALNF